MGFKACRLRAGKTVQEVMEFMEVSDAAVYSWEAGAYQPRAASLPKLAQFFGCTVDDLLRPDQEG